MTRRLPTKRIGTVSARPAEVWAGCGSGSGSAGRGRFMAKRVGDLSGRPAYVAAECRQGGSGTAGATGRFFAKRIGAIAGRPAYIRACCPTPHLGCCDRSLPATLYATVTQFTPPFQVFSFPMSYYVPSYPLGVGHGWYGVAATALTCDPSPYVHAWISCLDNLHWYGIVLCKTTTTPNVSYATGATWANLSTGCPDPFSKGLLNTGDTSCSTAAGGGCNFITNVTE